MFNRVKTDEIERDVFKRSQVVGGTTGAGGAHLVVGESNVHAPEQAVLDGPMGANRREQSLSVSRQATDVKASLDRRFALKMALGFNHRKGLQIEPLLGPG